MGAGLIAIACNTAHHWFDEVQASVDIPVLHIADAVALELKRTGAGPGATLGLMCTQGTIRSGFYHRRLGPAGYHLLVPYDDVQIRIEAAIRAVKAGHLDAGRDVPPQPCALLQAAEPTHFCWPAPSFLSCCEAPRGRAATGRRDCCTGPGLRSTCHGKDSPKCATAAWLARLGYGTVSAEKMSVKGLRPAERNLRGEILRDEAD